ncbi:MAG: CsgG/HfaB family protein [Spirochaetota bacterium]
MPNLENSGGLESEQLNQVSDMLRSRISESEVVEVVERQQMRVILREQELQESGLFDTSNAH